MTLFFQYVILNYQIERAMKMKKYVSDYEISDGWVGVEWEWEDGSRQWEQFPSSEAAELAMKENKIYNNTQLDYPVETPLGEQIDSGTEETDDRMTDAEADADTLASAGMGTDEDYNHYDYRDEENFFDGY